MTTHPPIVRDVRGGTDHLQLLILIALLAFVVLGAARMFGDAASDKFEEEAAWLADGRAQPHEPGALPEIGAPGEEAEAGDVSRWTRAGHWLLDNRVAASIAGRAFGEGARTPTYDRSGTYYQVAPDGTMTQLSSIEDAAALVRDGATLFMNGSLNTIDDAAANAHLLEATGGQGMVLVYMAQSYDYLAAEIPGTADHAANAAATRTFEEILRATDGAPITVASHSWSGRLVQHLVRDRPDTTHIAVNPAHGAWLRQGQFAPDLAGSQADVHLMIGTGQTRLLPLGIIACAESSDPGGHGCHRDVADAIRANPDRVHQHLIPGGEHGMASMLERGMGAVFARIRANAPPAYQAPPATRSRSGRPRRRPRPPG
jgi:hypothetical protein